MRGSHHKGIKRDILLIWTTFKSAQASLLFYLNWLFQNNIFATSIYHNGLYPEEQIKHRRRWSRPHGQASRPHAVQSRTSCQCRRCLQHLGQRAGVAREAYKDTDIQVFPSYEEMVNMPGLDAVWVSTSTDVHASQTLCAIEKGLHVLCEKPLSTDLAEVRKRDTTHIGLS